MAILPYPAIVGEMEESLIKPWISFTQNCLLLPDPSPHDGPISFGGICDKSKLSPAFPRGYACLIAPARWAVPSTASRDLIWGISEQDFPGCGRSNCTPHPEVILMVLGEDLMPWPSLSWRNAIVLIVPLLGMLLFCPKAFSQDLRHGEQLAKLWCASCHSVDAAGPVLRNEAVPSFSSIAGDSATSQASLEKFLNSSHPRMPAYGLTRKDVRDVAAYIISLRNEAR